jgi:phosphosulfolactate phosphohydrolase-like enzyme
MMLEVILSPAELPALAGRDLRNTTCVVFDVLRATSTFVTALHHGAKAVIPVAEISEALAIRQKQPGVLLGGERGGVKIRAGQTGGGDFDLGNSPREYTPEIVRGKTIVSTTTNGTRALRACAGAKTILAASFLNLTATAQFIRQLQPAELLLVCAGTRENMADEDVLAAGALCEILVAPQAASLLTNLVAADVSPRTLSQMNVSADSRRRLRSKGAKREKMLQGEGVQRTGLRGAEVAPATQAGEGFVQMTDSAETARNAWRKAKSNLLEVVSEAENARRLLAIPELRDDVAFCLRQDVFNLVAVLGRDGAIRVAA